MDEFELLTKGSNDPLARLLKERRHPAPAACGLQGGLDVGTGGGHPLQGFGNMVGMAGNGVLPNLVTFTIKKHPHRRTFVQVNTKCVWSHTYVG